MSHGINMSTYINDSKPHCTEPTEGNCLIITLFTKIKLTWWA